MWGFQSGGAGFTMNWMNCSVRWGRSKGVVSSSSDSKYWSLHNNCSPSDRFKWSVSKVQRWRLLLRLHSVVNVQKIWHSPHGANFSVQHCTVIIWFIFGNGRSVSNYFANAIMILPEGPASSSRRCLSWKISCPCGRSCQGTREY